MKEVQRCTYLTFTASVPFCRSDSEAQQLVQAYLEKRQKILEDNNGSSKSNTASTSHPITLNHVSDKEFAARQKARIREWLDQAVTRASFSNLRGEGEHLDLPPCNSFLRRYFYETLDRDYPLLVVESVKSPQNHNVSFLRIWRQTPQEYKTRQNRLVREAWQELIENKIGAYRVVLALQLACQGKLISDSMESLEEWQRLILSPSHDVAHSVEDSSPLPQLKSDKSTSSAIPLIVHNGLQDLLFLHTHFIGAPLPDDWNSCKKSLHERFPAIYDTKLIMSEYCPVAMVRRHEQMVRQQAAANNGAAIRPARFPTTLDAIYEVCCIPDFPFVEYETAGSTANSGGNDAHTADYDAFMTGAVYGVYVKETSNRVLHPTNHLYFHYSPYSIDLTLSSGSNHQDPIKRGMHPVSCVRVSNMDPSVTTRDLLRVCSNLTDETQYQIQFELIWVDDATVLIGVMIMETQGAILERHRRQGKIVYTALRNRFPNASIEYLVDILERKQQAELEESLKNDPSKSNGTKRSIWNLWGIFSSSGSSEDRRPTEPSERPAKRARVS